LLPFIGNMGRERCDPIEDSKDGEVFLCARFHLGAVENRAGILPVRHLFLGEGGAKESFSLSTGALRPYGERGFLAFSRLSQGERRTSRWAESSRLSPGNVGVDGN